MTNITQYPLLNAFKTTLNLAYAGGTGTISLTDVPEFTFPSGKTVLLGINMGKANEQVVRLDDWDNVVSISVKKNANGDLYTAQSHLKGDECVITDFFEDWDNVATAIASKSNIASPVFTGFVGLPKYADATARDTAIPSPTGQELILTGNLLQTYNTATTQRETKDAGTPPPQASETAQGIIELATTSEATTGTDTQRAMTPATTKAVIDTIDKSALYETGLIAGESITEGDHIRKGVSGGSESTSKRYKASALSGSTLPSDYPRIATSSAVLDGTFSAVYQGLYPYSGLTANTVYYASNTAGLISATAGTVSYVVGETNADGRLLLNSGNYYVSPGLTFEFGKSLSELTFTGNSGGFVKKKEILIKLPGVYTVTVDCYLSFSSNVAIYINGVQAVLYSSSSSGWITKTNDVLVAANSAIQMYWLSTSGTVGVRNFYVTGVIIENVLNKYKGTVVL